MADLSNVDSEKILSVASQLDGIVNSMAAQMRKVVDAVANLDKGWTSPVKAEFMSRYRRDEEAMSEMLAQYSEISVQLRETASDFDKTENEIMSGVSALK
ncbi:MAG: WXG100 family type VII secretion target [Oscillospiraceae bacterium]|nr:WXG100 family type VII secretion target [Oscillospiraceae bacterium]